MFRILYFLFFLILNNCFANVKEKSIQNCFRIENLPGPEDLSIDKKNEILYISSHARREMESIGKLYSINLKKEPFVIQEINTNYPKNFRPHGIHFAEVKNKNYLYAISHFDLENNKHSIEVFELGKETIHIQTIQNEFLVSPNDLFVNEKGQIFVSNDHGVSSKGKQFIEDLFGLNNSKISFFDGTKWKFFEPKINLGNGILYRKEKDKEFLYRASTTKEVIIRYEVLFQNNEYSLKEDKVFKFDTGPDNLEEDENGNILFGSHKSIYRFLWHASKKDRLSPSEIISLNPNSNQFEMIYANKGEEIPASSVGIIHKKNLFIGQVFDNFILSCKL